MKSGEVLVYMSCFGTRTIDEVGRGDGCLFLGFCNG